MTPAGKSSSGGQLIQVFVVCKWISFVAVCLVSASEQQQGLGLQPFFIIDSCLVLNVDPRAEMFLVPSQAT